MIVVIAGATGLTGRSLIEALSQDQRISTIRALVRKPGTLPPTTKLEEVVLSNEDFLHLSESSDPRLSGELYLCALGTTIRKAGSKSEFRKVDFTAVTEFSKLCEKRGGKSLGVVSAIGSNKHAPNFYSRVKGEAEQAILALDISRVVIARPALLIGDRSEKRLAERAGIKLFRALSPVLPLKIRSFLGTPVESLARRLLESTLQGSPGKIILEASELS
ncbi:oxidoreductase [bacterium]|nr:oxidoreductase [bacterium]